MKANLDRPHDIHQVLGTYQSKKKEDRIKMSTIFNSNFSTSFPIDECTPNQVSSVFVYFNYQSTENAYHKFQEVKNQNGMYLF